MRCASALCNFGNQSVYRGLLKTISLRAASQYDLSLLYIVFDMFISDRLASTGACDSHYMRIPKLWSIQ
jgi:hypothetical protein